MGTKVLQTATERIESVKAGTTAAAVFGLTQAALMLTRAYFGIELETGLAVLQNVLSIELATHLSIAVVSGFLFGVTYRYIIRGDRNSHLQDGAVLAFGLVRGLASIEGTEFSLWWSWNLLESLVCFAVARIALDTALKLKLLKPFV